MKKPALLPVIFCMALAGSTGGFAAGLPHVVAVKKFSLLYPSSASLQIPFNGCVALDAPLPSAEGEYWLSLDELIRDADFHQIEVLVDGNGGILGARAKFRGSPEEWEGARGYAARQRVLEVHLKGGGDDFGKELPAVYDANGFGEMVYAFDRSGNVSWRKPAETRVMREVDYLRKFEAHIRGCDDCRNVSPLPEVVLTRPDPPAKEKR